jgi:lipopolysaccharide export system protein LptA
MNLRPALLVLAALALLGPASPLRPTARAAATPAVPQIPTELRSEKLEMTSTDDETTAIATGNVILTGTNLRITCDQLTIIATRLGDKDATIGTIEKFKYILATGNVRIVQGDRESTSQRAEVFPREDKVVLSEEPVIIDHSNGFTAAGETITLFRGKREVFVDKPRFTGPPVGDLSANAAPRSTPAAPAVVFPKPDAK